MVAAAQRQGIAEKLRAGAVRRRPGGGLFHDLRRASHPAAARHHERGRGRRAAVRVGGRHHVDRRPPQIRSHGAVRRRPGVLQLGHHARRRIHALLKSDAHRRRGGVSRAQPLGQPFVRQPGDQLCRLYVLAVSP